MFFLFFKQKMTYKMRISDWSSDVCSSDLPAYRSNRRSSRSWRRLSLLLPGLLGHFAITQIAAADLAGDGHRQCVDEGDGARIFVRREAGADEGADLVLPRWAGDCALAQHDERSEEHTPGLQSLMRSAKGV